MLLPLVITNVFLATLAAADVQVAKLQCSGTYTNTSIKSARDIAVDGIYLEIRESELKIVGAAGFEGDYRVITKREDGIGFQLDKMPTFSGFLNRLSGHLSLTEKTNKISDQSTGVIKQLIVADCKKAEPLF